VQLCFLVAATYNNLGCWRDTTNRAIPPREGDPILDGATYKARVRAIGKCAQVAHNNGDEVFAVQVKQTEQNILNMNR